MSLSISSFLLPNRNRRSQTKSENRQLAIGNVLNPAPFRRPASIMRNWCRITDRADANPGIIDRANRRLAATARAFHAHLTLLHSGFHGLARRLVSRLLRGEGRAFA